jgi:hypothetical protein
MLIRAMLFPFLPLPLWLNLSTNTGGTEARIKINKNACQNFFGEKSGNPISRLKGADLLVNNENIILENDFL